MKRIVRASKLLSMDETKAKQILRKSKELFDLMEDAREGFVEEFDIGDLYDTLADSIRAITYRLEEE